ncbi:hypothetical protein KP509_11G042300 [Ceratopteris richardii]|uniref:Kinesin motor domain-containing protein n=1 Tax=Ceratopteris richardii TaxID=49495 RepID=A0A8T2TRV9_CERRI|nr:hypothetical protein KP509_11G042300 [Ceratopteris richardii]KAH7425158.1 hypothetical protein KP509_11G042300 [Ceratopteris richardii]
MSELSMSDSNLTSDSSSTSKAEATVDSAYRISSDEAVSCQRDSTGDADPDLGWIYPKDTAKDEKIHVSVRLRPLSKKEIADNHYSIWECPDDKTVVCLHSRPDRSNFPQSYVFDQVFRAETTTKEVYKKGARDVVLSALTGKNATIFAYGQTSSGKTYTMNGVTDSAADDIFNYIKQHNDYIFLLKFSALEIYNEVVSDLLRPEGGPLRIMDDRERGMVIEKLKEEIIKDKSHLRSLLEVCEAHRQVGETALNDMSSRSHQIIRLTIESSPRAMADEGPMKSLIAALNFVDLAGSERVSLTHSEGTTLKEGCYINRSLLTLSTVIRKLSDPNRPKTAHIPYRESKLTRILSNALGGNARTAIICTMSSSNKHLEQTRNSLFFASYAKEVTNKAQVNVVISDKELIKQLKKEVALLEAQLRRSSLSSQSSYDALLQEKDEQIKRMQEEMGKAFQQRDSARSELLSFRKQVEELERGRIQVPNKLADQVEDSLPSFRVGNSTTEANGYYQNGHMRRSTSEMRLKTGNLQRPWNDVHVQVPQKTTNSASAILLDEIYKLEHLQNELAQDANRALEAVQKEVECLCLTQTDMNQEAAMTVSKLQSEISSIYESRATGASIKGTVVPIENISYSLKDDIERAASKDLSKVSDADTIEKMLTQMQIKTHGFQFPARLPSQGEETGHRETDIINPQQAFHYVTTPAQAEESIRSVYAYVTDMKERISKLQYQKQLLVQRVLELEKNADEDTAGISLPAPTSPESWKSEFHEKRKQIFELWNACNVSLIHRSQFYLLFRGDPADAIYLEVELRRLSWLKEHHVLTNTNKTHLRGSDQISSPASSMRIIKKERESIVKNLYTRLTATEREEIYREWDIPLDSKQRRVRLANMVWTDHQNEMHVEMSAKLVAKVVALWNGSGPVSKEMFQLSLSPATQQKTRFPWSPITSLFRLGSA